MVLYFPGQTILLLTLLSLFTLSHSLPTHNYIFRNFYLPFTRKAFLLLDCPSSWKSQYCPLHTISVPCIHTSIFALLQCHNILQCSPVTYLPLFPAVNLKLRDYFMYFYMFRGKHSSLCTEDGISILIQFHSSLNSVSMS
jgi:hypothetical protein